jgi:hemolysin III
MPSHRPQSRHEELANVLTHGSGLAASLLGFPLLLLVATRSGDLLQIIGCAVFAVTLVLLYAASTVYHALPASPAKHTLRLLDHIAIYLLIAGTYTPFALGVLRGTWGWTLFGLIWTLAALGILSKIWLGHRYPRLSTLMYLGMGWLAVIAIRPLTAALPTGGLAWLVAGGLCYTAGVVFYVQDWRRYRHTIWHLFVLTGSACHYAAVLRYATGPLR